jgi:hypothetical protein
MSGKPFFGVLLGVCAVAGKQVGACAQEFRCPAMQGQPVSELASQQPCRSGGLGQQDDEFHLGVEDV